MRLVMLAIVAAILLYGCALPSEYTFSVEGSEEDRAAFSEALSEWGMCHDVHGRIGEDGIPVHPVSELDEPDESAKTYGRGDPTEIRYRPDRPRLREVFAHEIGHAFGLRHSDTGVMQAVRDEHTERFVSLDDCRDLTNR